MLDVLPRRNKERRIDLAVILAWAAQEAARTEAKAAMARRREERRAAMQAWGDGAMARQVAANRRWRATPMGRLLTKESNRRYFLRRKLREAGLAPSPLPVTRLP